MRDIRVLSWTPFYWPNIGGIEIFAADLLAGLRERGHEVAVITGHPGYELPDEDTRNGVPIYRLPFIKALEDRDPLAILEVRKRVAALKTTFAPDVIHINFSDPSVLFHLQTLTARPAPFAVTVHALAQHEGGAESLLGRLLREADRVVAVSGAILRQIRLIEPEIEARSSLIYNGLAVPSLAPAPRPLNPPRLVCLGRVIEEKGFDLAIAALAELIPDFPGIRLTVAGDGPALPGLKNQARDLGIAEAVDFVGWVSPDAVPELMNTATVMVMPSRWEEPFGLVAVEAALMARPVVAARVGGLAEVVADGEGGHLVDKDDAAAIARAVGHLLQDPEAADRMGRAGRQRAQEMFSLDSEIDAYETLFRSLVEGGVDDGNA